MNKQQKIIVSIVGITIVLLALLGITYAYYLTRIEGNTNTNSISVTTANLSLVYGDGTTKILTSDTLLMPGEFEGTKDFTVTNNGNASVTYGVILEDMINPLTRPEDMKMTLSCSSSIENDICSGLEEMNLPSTNEFLVENTIEVGETHTYELKLRYIEAGVDQSIDMGKTISGKVNIIDSHDTVDMTGVVANYEEGDYVQVNSEPKISYITNDGKYKVVGLKPEQHTIAVYKKDGTLKGDKELTIKSGTSESISENEITITKDTRTITMNITAINTDNTITTGSTTLKEYNIFPDGTLASAIYKNSKSHKNGTYYMEKGPTIPGKESISSNWEYSSPVPIKMDYSDYSNFWYSSNKDKDMLECYDGYYDEETSSWLTNCDGVIKGGVTSCEDVVGKKIFDTDYWSEYYVDGCLDGAPTSGLARYEKILSIEEDEYGLSYYYRGNVDDNFVDFAGMCWRIVRILGNGKIKLILEDKDNICSESIGDWSIGTGPFGYETVGNIKYKRNYLHPTYNVDQSMSTIFKNFQNNELSSYLDYLSVDNWCINDAAYLNYSLNDKLNLSNPLTSSQVESYYASKKEFYFESNIRLRNVNVFVRLDCPGTVLTNFDDHETSPTPMYVATLTADEVALAGGGMYASSPNYYLINDYQKVNSQSFFTLSYGRFCPNCDGGFVYGPKVEPYGSLSFGWSYGNYDFDFRPSIILKKDILVSDGEGTKSNPYVID